MLWGRRGNGKNLSFIDMITNAVVYYTLLAIMEYSLIVLYGITAVYNNIQKHPRDDYNSADVETARRAAVPYYIQVETER